MVDVACFIWSQSCGALEEPPCSETGNFKTEAFLTEYGQVPGIVPGTAGRAVLLIHRNNTG